MIEFSSYQNTNTPWIGEIPTDWSLKSLKHIFTEKKSTKNPDLGSGSISFGKVIYKDDEKIPESTKESYQEVLDGEFLINPLNLNYDLKSLRIGLSRINVVVSQGYIVLKIKDGFVPEYFEYLLRKFDVEHMKSLGQGVRQTISYTHLKDEKLVVPPVKEQNQICRYLDKKTSQIDSLINKIEKKIELLKEQRSSLINQYVTKGLDPDVELKDSGIEWVGQIPIHWNIKPLWTISKLKSIIESDHLELLSVYLNEGVIKFSDVDGKRTNVTSEDKSKYQKVDPGDFVLNNQQAWRGSVGVSRYRGIVSPAYIVLEVDSQLDSTYSNYLFRDQSMVNHYLLSSKGIGTIQRNLYYPSLRSIPVFVPPFKEQKHILIYLDKKTEQIDLLSKKIQKKIELLKEYRQSLISSIVTGKLKITEDML